jgi:integrin beta 2
MNLELLIKVDLYMSQCLTVLPRFDIKLSTPKYIKPLDKLIDISVFVRYTYGGGVVGLLDIKLGICNEDSTKVYLFRQNTFYLTSQDKGSKHLSFPNSGYSVFPYGWKFCVVAEATENASGIKYLTSDNSAMFTDNPIKIDCELTPPFYRPKLPLQMQIRARYPNGEAVGNIEVVATQPDGSVRIQTTNQAGVAYITVDVGNINGDLEIKVNVKNQALGIRCIFKEFCSPCNEHITVRPKVLGRQTVGKMADFEIIRNSCGRQLSVAALVVARGSIHSSASVVFQSGSPITSFQVPVTPQLADRFCVLVYFLAVCNQVVADGCCVDTDKACSNEISLHLDKNTVEPGDTVAIDVNVDCPNSDIVLLAVDRGLYMLNKENNLSRDKLFQTLDTCSRSCGHTTASSEGIFDAVGLAGISSLSTNMNPSCGCCIQSCRTACLLTEDICSPASRKRRSAKLETYLNNLSLIPKNETAKYEFCLAEYKKLVETSTEQGLSEADALEIYTSCLGTDRRARSIAPSDYGTFAEIDYPKRLQHRAFFPHVWLQQKNFNNGEINLKVPDSITQWSIYGIAQCCATGFCVSEPVSLTVFKPVFVDCHIPYSIRRLEQVSIACTAYNNKEFSIRVINSFYLNC